MITATIPLRENKEDVYLKAYVLDDSPGVLNGAKRPAVLICPGGAYLFCSDREAEPVALAFAAMGYHAFVLYYSRYYYDGEEASGDMPPKPERAFPAPMRDIALAMRAIHARAGEWFVNTDQIILCGFSAGSHNCAMYSVYWDKPVITDFVHGQYRPAAAILCYGLSDYLEQAITGDELQRAANIALFGTEAPDENARRACSPAHLISGSTPPIFLWATAADELVPVAHSLNMAKGLAEKNIPFELHLFERGRHGLCLATRASAGTADMVDADAAQWVPLAGRWLEKRFALPLKDQ